MNDINEIYRIRSISTAVIDEKYRNILYKVYLKNGDSFSITVILPLTGRPTFTSAIIDDAHEFINGVKVIKLENGEYGYLREADNKLLPYRYDYATDFNNSGYALVAKDGLVSWIDRTFKYLSSDGMMVENYINNKSSFKGYIDVYNFTNGSIPLSKVSTDRKVSYFGLDGKIKKFYMYDGKFSDYPYTSFNVGGLFDGNGIAIDDEKILFAKGYFCTIYDFIKICKQNGTFLKLSEAIDNSFNNVKRRK